MYEDPMAFIQNIIEAIGMSFYMIFSIEITKYLLKDIENKDINHFYRLIFIYALVSILLMGARFSITHWWWARISMWWVKKLSNRYLTQFIQADGNEIEKIWTGRFISILEKWMYKWMDVLFDTTFSGTVNLIMVIYAMYTIICISIIGWIISIFLMILAGIIATYANIWMAEKRQIRRKEQNEANHQTVVALMSKNELLQNSGLKNLLAKIDYHLDAARRNQEVVNIGFVVIEEFPRFIFLLVRIGVYIFILKSSFIIQSSIVDIGIFVTIITIAEKNLNEFLHMFRWILREFSQISVLWETFDSLQPIVGYHSGSSFSPQSQNIEINSISYGYNETRVFFDFSLTIQKGKKTALVGASGGGKTTLMKLIAGYLHPESGSISVLWNELDKTALKTYYPHIGYLTQDPWVFDATIRENLISAMSQADSDWLEKKLINALKLAHCDFVFELEHWLDTEIGERGVRLSWGQKQRLAIAKIFLKNPEIILLDEPTSALDSFSEEKITEALDTLFKNRTVIIIAHRLQTVKRADEIMVIEWGKIVEKWDHISLVTKWWIYNRMLELQSGF